MTHKYQGKNLPTPHTPACTAAPGPCICTNVTDTAKPALNAGRLESATLDPNGMGMIGLRVDEPEDSIIIKDEEGAVVAVFASDYSLTGGKLHRTIEVYKSIVVSARNENRALANAMTGLRLIYEKSERSSRRTIYILGAALIINLGVTVARSLGWF